LAAGASKAGPIFPERSSCETKQDDAQEQRLVHDSMVYRAPQKRSTREQILCSPQTVGYIKDEVKMILRKTLIVLAALALVMTLVGHNNAILTGLGKALFSVFVIGYFILSIVGAQSRS
jgi:hypothetical protein